MIKKSLPIWYDFTLIAKVYRREQPITVKTVWTLRLYIIISKGKNELIAYRVIMKMKDH